jgi:hypothetical protein
MSPRQSVESECGRRGRAAVVAGCIDVLDGRGVDEELVVIRPWPPHAQAAPPSKERSVI